MMSHEINEIRDFLEPIEDVPPMPEDTHARWTQAVHHTQQSTVKPSAPWKRGLAVAAAAVFLLGGTALTRDSLNPTAASDTAPNGLVTMAYSRAKGADYAASNSNSVMLMAGAAYDGLAYEESIVAEAAESRKLIRTVDMTIATRAYDESLAAINQACEAVGGWVEYLSENANNLRSAYMTLRIPAEALDGFLSGTAGWGRITNRSENTQDVTDSYQDTQARLATQQALMARLQALTVEAADLSDVLALEAQMADTQYQIDRLTASLMSTDRQVNYATVSLNLREEAVHADNPEQTLGQRLVNALASGWEFLTEWTEDTLVFLLAASPFLALAGAVLAVWKFIRRKKKKFQ